LGSIWLDNLIYVAKVVRDAGELAPFPYIKGTANLVITVLERIKASYDTPLFLYGNAVPLVMNSK
jgi:hypothetical protein